jgi:hypothetical protein
MDEQTEYFESVSEQCQAKLDADEQRIRELEGLVRELRDAAKEVDGEYGLNGSIERMMPIVTRADAALKEDKGV